MRWVLEEKKGYSNVATGENYKRVITCWTPNTNTKGVESGNITLEGSSLVMCLRMFTLYELRKLWVP